MKHFYFCWLMFCCFTVSFAQFSEDFESDDLLENGWTKYQTGADDPGFVFTTSRAHSGNSSYYHDDANISGVSTSYLVTPAYTVSEGDVFSVYVYQRYSDDYYDYSGILISTSTSDPIASPAAFSELEELGANTAELSWERIDIPLDAYVGQTVYFAFAYTGDFAHEFYIDDLNIGESCESPEAEIETVASCDTNEFTVEVEVSDFGSAATITVTDNLGGSQTLSAPGTLTFGPYASGTDVSINVANTDNPACFVTFSASYTCPPANDNCATAEEITAFPFSETGNAYGATQSSFVTCGINSFNDGVWYSFTAASAEYEITVTPTGWDTALAVFSGSCDGLSCVGSVNAAISGQPETVSFIGQAGVTYYVVFGHYSNTVDGNEGPFVLDIQENEIPCAAPTNLAVAAVTDLSLTATWQGNAENEFYDLAWGPTGFTPGATPNASNLGGTTYQVTGLTPETTYDIYVRGNCTPGYSTWVGPITFTTLEPGAILAGTDCAHPINVTELPYSTTDNTTNYGDDYDGNSNIECNGLYNYYLGGDDVVYAYSSETDTSIDIEMIPDGTWSAIYVYDDCNNIGGTCLAAAGGYDTTTRLIDNFEVTGGTTYYFVISTWASPQTVGYTLNITENTCVDLSYEFSATGDCDNSQYYVDINFSSLGSSEFVEVTDNQGNPMQSSTTAGVLTFGPYAEGSLVTFDFVTDDINCYESATYGYTCPALNDECEDAIELTLGTQFSDFPVIGNNIGATASATMPAPGCANYQGGEVWFTVVVPESGHVIVEGNPNPEGGITDAGMAIYSGSCDALTLVECDDDDSPNGLFPMIELTNQTPGTTLYIAVWEYGNDVQGSFQVSAYDNYDCVPGAFTHEAIADCDTDSYQISVDVTSLGSSSTIVITPSVGDPVTITEPGILTFGPYDFGTLVNFNVDAEGTTCDRTFSYNYLSCPPQNDDCIDAEAVTVGTNFASNSVTGSNFGATSSANMPAPGCAYYQGGEVWYTAVVPESGHIILEANRTPTTAINDMGMAVYGGTCDALTLIECDDDDSPDGLYPRIELFDQTPGTTLYIAVWEYGNDTFGDFYFSAFDDQTCTAPVYTSEYDLDCDTETFTVTIDFTDLGSAETITLTDNQESAVQTVSATGTYTFGPYEEGTSVSISVDTGDENCFTTVTYTPFCPAANDECIDAEEVTVGTSFASNAVLGTNVGATASETMPAPGCAYYQGGEVWYTATVPASGHIIFEANRTPDTAINDMGMAVYSGSCDSLTLVECDDDDSPDGLYPRIELTGYEAGAVLYIAVWEYGNDITGSFYFSAYDDQTCTAPTFTTSTDVDCEAATYTIDYEFTSLGTAESITLTDDQGSAPIVITETGTVTFGPYAEGAPVVISVDTGDANCASSQTFAALCPAVNDECEDAIALTVGNVFTDYPVTGNNIGATASADMPAPGCAYYQGGEVWYTVTVPSSGNVTIEGNPSVPTTIADMGMAVYSGTCGTLTFIECDDDDSSNGLFPLIALTGRTPGEVLYVAIWEYGNDATGSFQIAAYDDSVVVEECDPATLTALTALDCDTDTFTVTYTVSGIGSSEFLVFTDDQGSEAVTVSEVGDLTFGPYAEGTTVTISIDPSDPLCTLTSETFTETCPVDDCEPVIYTTATALDCETDTFMVTYTVTDLGTNEFLVISDGETDTNVVEAGDYTFGPYAEGSSVTITLDPSNPICNSTTTTFTETCPIDGPENDECSGSIGLAVGEVFEDEAIVATLTNATASDVADPSCGTYEGGDVWFSVVVPENGRLAVSTAAVDGSDVTSIGIAGYAGSCGGLFEDACDFATDGNAELSYTGLTPGTVYYVRVWSNGAEGDFVISAYSSTLGVGDVAGNTREVSLYPNPTTSVLNVAGFDVASVKVVSASGQLVHVSVNNNVIDTRKLPTGTYVIQLVDQDGKVVTRKFIKK